MQGTHCGLRCRCGSSVQTHASNRCPWRQRPFHYRLAGRSCPGPCVTGWLAEGPGGACVRVAGVLCRAVPPLPAMHLGGRGGVHVGLQLAGRKMQSGTLRWTPGWQCLQCHPCVWQPLSMIGTTTSHHCVSPTSKIGTTNIQRSTSTTQLSVSRAQPLPSAAHSSIPRVHGVDSKHTRAGYNLRQVVGWAGGALA